MSFARFSNRSALAFAGLLLGFGTACSVPQSEVCAQYVACAAHADVVFDLTATNTSAYVPDGTCWRDEETGKRCTEACEESLADLQKAIDLAGEPRGDCG